MNNCTLLKRAKREACIATCLAGTAIILALISVVSAYNEPVSQPQQNIQSVQCIGAEGDLDTYHIHIPIEVTDKASFIEGFCQSI